MDNATGTLTLDTIARLRAVDAALGRMQDQITQLRDEVALSCGRLLAEVALRNKTGGHDTGAAS